MATNKNRSNKSKRIAVRCSCDNRFSVLPQHAGKLMKCPACGRELVVPANSSTQSAIVATKAADESEGLSRGTLIAMWSFVGVFACACILFIVWHTRGSQQAKVNMANNRISEATATANDWLAGDSLLDGEAVEQQIRQALGNQLVTEKHDAEVVLDKVVKRRARIASTAIFEDAKRQLEDKHVNEAIALLKMYLADPYATEKADAKLILIEAETAISDNSNLDVLIAMNDDEFARTKASGIIDDGKVTHPVLLEIRKETIQRNLDTAIQQREKIRLVEEERRNAERLEAIERQRQEKERQIAEEAKQRAAAKAEQERIAILRNPIDDRQPGLNSKIFEQVVNFPEKFEGKAIKWAVVYNTDLNREEKHSRFGFGVRFPFSSKRFLSSALGKDLYFAISEQMALELTKIGIEGRQLDITFEIVKDPHRDGAYVARVYRVLVRNPARDLVEDLTWEMRNAP